MNNENSKKILPITLFIILISMIIIQWGYINNLENKINSLENKINNLEQFTNINNINLENFKASRLPLWRECNNREQIGKPLAYAWVLVNKDYIIKVPEDQLAFKNGTLYECRGSLIK